MLTVGASSREVSARESAHLPAAGRFLVELFDRFLVGGRVRFRIGESEISAGSSGGSDTVLRVHDPRFFARVVRYGNLGLGEAFMNGEFTVDEGELHEFLTACLRSRFEERFRRDVRLVARALYHRARALLDGAARNVRSLRTLAGWATTSGDTRCGFATGPGWW